MIGGEVDAGGRRRQRTDSGRTGLEFLAKPGGQADRVVSLCKYKVVGNPHLLVGQLHSSVSVIEYVFEETEGSLLVSRRVTITNTHIHSVTHCKWSIHFWF